MLKELALSAQDVKSGDYLKVGGRIYRITDKSRKVHGEIFLSGLDIMNAFYTVQLELIPDTPLTVTRF